MLRPVRLSCSITSHQSPQEIAAIFLDLSKWSLFSGYGPLPGIKSASYTMQTPEIVGSIIAAVCTDNSTHSEEVIEWDLPHSFRLKLSNFSPPLSFFATHFDEWTHFELKGDETIVTRTMHLFPRHIFAYPLLWFVRPLMRKAIIRSHEAITGADL